MKYNAGFLVLAKLSLKLSIIDATTFKCCLVVCIELHACACDRVIAVLFSLPQREGILGYPPLIFVVRWQHLLWG